MSQAKTTQYSKQENAYRNAMKTNEILWFKRRSDECNMVCI